MHKLRKSMMALAVLVGSCVAPMAAFNALGQELTDAEGNKVESNAVAQQKSGGGFYDIVFEDNGPGVAEEHVDKLFTPNFTTKNSGSGLGLAISRSVLERCGAAISYSRSFSLGGACFTILFPKG